MDLLVAYGLKESLQSDVLQFVMTKDGVNVLKVTEIADLADLYVNNRIGLIKQEKENNTGIGNRGLAISPNWLWENRKYNTSNWKNSGEVRGNEVRSLDKKTYFGGQSNPQSTKLHDRPNGVVKGPIKKMLYL